MSKGSEGVQILNGRRSGHSEERSLGDEKQIPPDKIRDSRSSSGARRSARDDTQCLFQQTVGILAGRRTSEQKHCTRLVMGSLTQNLVCFRRRKSAIQGRMPVPMTISSGMFNSRPFQNFLSAARISATAAVFFSGVSRAISGRNGAATSLNCSQYSSGVPAQCPFTMRASSWTLAKPAASRA